jgi:hypothetical protein
LSPVSKVWEPGGWSFLRLGLEFEKRRDFSSCAAIAADAEETAACRYVSEVEWRLARTQPSTLAGVAAVLRFVNEIEDANLTWPDSWEGWHYQLRATMARAIEALISAQAGKAVQA